MSVIGVFRHPAGRGVMAIGAFSGMALLSVSAVTPAAARVGSGIQIGRSSTG